MHTVTDSRRVDDLRIAPTSRRRDENGWLIIAGEGPATLTRVGEAKQAKKVVPRTAQTVLFPNLNFSLAPSCRSRPLRLTSARLSAAVPNLKRAPADSPLGAPPRRLLPGALFRRAPRINADITSASGGGAVPSLKLPSLR